MSPADQSDSAKQLPGPPQAGNPLRADELFTMLYKELHWVADRALRRVGGPATLSPTAVLHEAWLDLCGKGSHPAPFQNQNHFMAYAARAMRGVVIDYSRRSQAQKRGGAFELTSLPTEVPELRVDDTALTRLSDGLEEMAKLDPRLAEVVDLKYFCGFSFAEIAALRGQNERTVQRDWEKARLLLHRAVSAAE